MLRATTILTTTKREPKAEKSLIRRTCRVEMRADTPTKQREAHSKYSSKKLKIKIKIEKKNQKQFSCGVPIGLAAFD